MNPVKVVEIIYLPSEKSRLVFFDKNERLFRDVKLDPTIIKFSN